MRSQLDSAQETTLQMRSECNDLDCSVHLQPEIIAFATHLQRGLLG